MAERPVRTEPSWRRHVRERIERWGRVRVGVDIAAAEDEVWASVEDVAGHVEWMADAVAIRFRSEQREGVGTTFECDTRIGPITLTDVMTVTVWEPPRVMGVRHDGIVGGLGRFDLAAAGVGTTRFTWTEELLMPWWLGGRLGAIAARPVLAWIWRRNLRRLRALVEGAAVDA